MHIIKRYIHCHNYYDLLQYINIRAFSYRLVSKNERSSVSLTAGQVEILFAGRWGTIYSDKFKLSDAMGLCHILTHSSDVLAYGVVGSTNLE